MHQKTEAVKDLTIHSIPMVIELSELLTLIPHRYPFLMIDKIEQVTIGQSAVGIKNVSINEHYFQGHFPKFPIMPGVLIIEALAQTAAALVMKTLKIEGKAKETPNNVFFMSIEKAKFRKPVLPGQTLNLHVQKDKVRGSIWQFKGEAYVNNTLTDEAVFTAMIGDSF